MHDVVRRVSSHWLVFDLGGVLVDVAHGDVTHSRLAADFGIQPARLDELLTTPDAGQAHSAIQRFETGELSVDGLLARLNEVASTPLTRDEFVVSLNAMLLGCFDETAELVAELSEAGYGIACYSNTNPVHWSHIQRQFAFFDDIIEPFASHVVGHRKPDPEGYERVCAALDAKPGDCVLIDDRIENVEGARAAHWQAHHFTGISGLRAALADIGVDSRAAS
ncbi:HAD family phosphatase [uncultured Salinisphaera sp.]|uniref:HAD family hydrolase n=1 Tax=uncultured Salinisphaera sp. TaxID=359372 RepID=UPI0032B2A1B7|tara:strand:- start:2309 stop:2974 length:666 start_codon:yes stop_codon:yes gene_type:complete